MLLSNDLPTLAGKEPPASRERRERNILATKLLSSLPIHKIRATGPMRNKRGFSVTILTPSNNSVGTPPGKIRIPKEFLNFQSHWGLDLHSHVRLI